MKKLILLCCLANALYCSAQIKAVTESGDEVILYDNKTWDYSNAEVKEEKEIKTNSATFSKSKDASFFLKSKTVTDLGIYLNPKKWSFKKSESDAESEYTFELKGKDAYGMIITERIEVPLNTLKGLAIDNAKSIAPDIKVVMEEYRIVNGKKVFCMQMNGTTQGVKFSYFGYYYAYEHGTIQFITYTSQSLLNEYKPDMEELLNGFTINE